MLNIPVHYLLNIRTPQTFTITYLFVRDISIIHPSFIQIIAQFYIKYLKRGIKEV